MRLATYQQVRQRTENLARPLSEEDCGVQSMPDASPTKWHLAHSSWFFETFVLAAAVPGYRAFDPHFAYLFNSYYEALGPRQARPQRGLLTRPSLAQVQEYRRHVDDAIGRLLQGGAVGPETAARIELGLHHEQQHQELILTDIKHAFSQNALLPAYASATAVADAEAATPIGWIEHQGGLVEVGHEGSSFAFDNEGPRHPYYLQPFGIASRLITNAEYLAFIEDRGYLRPEFWLVDGWSKVQAEGWFAPLYWQQRDDRWWQFTLAGLREFAPSEPVCHVSFYEADAYCRWAGDRLATEQEWEIASMGSEVSGNFAEGGYLHPRAAVPAIGSCRQMFGDTWEWTRSAYAPYPRYRPTAGALGEYNGKFMCNQIVLRGGSCVTPASHMRATYRNFFPPDARWQFSGIRLARDL